jgi:hypothetical protein
MQKKTAVSAVFFAPQNACIAGVLQVFALKRRGAAPPRNSPPLQRPVPSAFEFSCLPHDFTAKAKKAAEKIRLSLKNVLTLRKIRDKISRL